MSLFDPYSIVLLDQTANNQVVSRTQLKLKMVALIRSLIRMQ